MRIKQLPIESYEDTSIYFQDEEIWSCGEKHKKIVLKIHCEMNSQDIQFSKKVTK